jgi:spore maturation protein CgeB
MQRPKRISVINETGRKQSLPSGKGYFEMLPGTGKPVFLGLGPEPEKLLLLFPEIKQADYIECPDFFKTSSLDKNTIPSEFTEIKFQETSADRLRSAPIIIYTPARKIFPSFWGPKISKITLLKHPIPGPRHPKTIWITGDENSLLASELAKASSCCGLQSRIVAPEELCDKLLTLLGQEIPEIILSINFSGIDSLGENYHLLENSGVKTVVWLVDNPFHILSGLKSTFWHQIPMLVTDHWFIPRLMECGAEKVGHMPLATDPELFSPACSDNYAKNLRDIVFVGRSEFPGKKSFFAGCNMSPEELSLARQMIAAGHKPDFAFWTKKDCPQNFWPASEIRNTGFKAEESGKLWRSTCLKSVQNQLTVFGDHNWNELLPLAETRSPVDYYTTLPSIYKQSKITLNMTSPLLPYGLTQRNFDVWAAGGFLLSDSGRGLKIFPEELVKAISFDRPADLKEISEKFLAAPSLRSELSNNWRRIILKEHTYHNRIEQLIDFIK